MDEKRYLTLAEVDGLAHDAAAKIEAGSNVYAIPRGGIPAAFAMSKYADFTLVDDPADADYIVDDLIDSGATMQRILAQATPQPPGRRVFKERRQTPVVLLDKREPAWKGAWVVFPWEGDSVGSGEDIVLRLLQFIGEDPARGGLAETPARVIKAWEFWCSGYGRDPAELFKTFEDGAEKVDEMVLVRDIPFYTHCEHHLAPFFGTATVGYIPRGRVVGLSKINRLVDLFARRLQVQERLTTQIADTIMAGLEPKGVGVIIQARHLCMESRGVCQQGHSTITSAVRGVMENGTPRQEFLTLAGR
jgi:GTP cyclohydrolase I